MKSSYDPELEAMVAKFFRTQELSVEYSAEFLVTSWVKFSRDCTDGYPWDLDDYDNSTFLRSELGLVFPAAISGGFPTSSRLASDVQKADDAAQEVLTTLRGDQKQDGPWWKINLPSYACASFCREVRKNLGIHLDSRSKFDSSVLDMRRIAEPLGPDEKSKAFIEARDTIEYLSGSAALLSKACGEIFRLNHAEKITVWKWANGRIGDIELIHALNSR